MLHKMRNVVHSMAQRRHVELDHVQSVVQVFAEAALENFPLQIAVRGGHHLHVDVHGHRRADRRHFVLLQHAQQFRLELERHFADFIQKHDAAFGGAKHAQAAPGRAGKRALLVTEQLAFGKRGGERGAIDGHKRFVAPRSQAMQQARPKFFAGARFAADQNRALNIGSALHMAQCDSLWDWNQEPSSLDAREPAEAETRSKVQRARVAFLLCSNTLTPSRRTIHGQPSGGTMAHRPVHTWHCE